jgi:hypothetical protein
MCRTQPQAGQPAAQTLRGVNMAYSRVTDEELKEIFGVEKEFRASFFNPRPDFQVSDLLRQTLAENLSFALAQKSEKARSEFIIAPVLAELRKKAGGKISLFSGIRFDVDKSHKLDGECDFLISRSSYQAVLEAPVVIAVEAKRQDFEKGFTQCIAEMIAARIFNERKNSGIREIYGCVTIGNAWQFLVLRGDKAIIDTTVFDVNEDLERILSMLYTMSLGLLKN